MWPHDPLFGLRNSQLWDCDVQSPHQLSKAAFTVTTVKSDGVVVMRIERLAKNHDYAPSKVAG